METEYLKRWRMALGGNAADGTGVTLTVEEQRLDSSLEAVYDSDRRGGLGSSAPKVSRWLGDIREFFPQTVVQVIQRDAIKRLHIDSLLTEKEMLATVVPDVHLVATLMSLGRAIPEKNKDMARQVVRKVVDDLLRKLSSPTQQAVTGALNRSARRRNPRYNEIDWKTTIIKNLKNYQPQYKTVIPEVRIGYGRKCKALKDIILCLDQAVRWEPLSYIPASSVRYWPPCRPSIRVWWCSTLRSLTLPMTCRTRLTCCSVSSSAEEPT